MTTVASFRNSEYETTCAKCGESMIAPEWSEYFDEEQCVLNLWSCKKCGYEFETEIHIPAEAQLVNDRIAVQAFFPSLLVA